MPPRALPSQPRKPMRPTTVIASLLVVLHRGTPGGGVVRRPRRGVQSAPMEAFIGSLMMCLLGGVGVLVLYGLLGFFVVQPRTQVVVLRFGKYSKTIQHDGISYSFPFGRTLYRLSAQVVSVELPRMTVLEAHGKPIEG